DVAEDLDSKLTQESLGQGPYRHACSSFTSAGTFQDIARIAEIVLDSARQIRKAGPGPGDRFLLVFTAVDVLDRQRFCPILPVFVSDENGDGRPDGFRMPNAGNNFDAICFDLHA